MARIKKYAEVLTQNLTNYQTYVVDLSPNSTYFRITEFKDTFTGGKNGFLIEGSEHLKETTEIKIEILDVNGNPIYYEPGNGVPEYYEGVSKVIAVYVYDDTPIGNAKITILGELKTYVDENGITQDIPDTWKGVYNVKWEKPFNVNKLLSNEDKVRFYRRPEVSITEIVKPIFSNVVSTKSQSGFLNGTALAPNLGQALSGYTAPASYLLTTTGNTFWTGSIVGTYLTFPSLTYTPLVTSIINSRQVVVQTPYTENGLVTALENVPYNAVFDYVEGVDNVKTALTGSFAKINLTDLTTFVGDVARVKIFRKSQSEISDYQFVQEIKLESNELLVDLTSTTKNQENYGIFDGTNIKTYWVTSSNNITTTYDQTFLFNSVELNSTGVNKFYTSKSLDITEGNEYTLDFNIRKETIGSTDEYIEFYLSGSRPSLVNGSPITVQVKQSITTLKTQTAILQKQNIVKNIEAEQIENAKLYADVKGTGWHIADVSLKASQETAFSPDEITFIQSVPRSLPIETFDYRFEFYDINNNYIPVLVEESKTFDGGNLQTIRKQLRLIPSSTGFQFDSGSNPVPPTVITVEIEKTLLTGSVTFTSQSFDFFGNALTASQYTASVTPLYSGSGQYPGRLDNIVGATPFLTVAAFTGSRSDINVQLVSITGECEGFTDTINIYKILDGFGGVNHIIRDFRGTQIRNSSTSSLEIQAVRIDGINDIILNASAQKNYGNIQLHIISKSLEGVEKFVNLAYVTASNMVYGLTTGSLGSKEINYNATFNRDSIDFRRVVYLMPSSSAAGKFAYEASASVLASVILEDLQDGLDSGKVIFNADSFTINPRLDTQFKPIFAFATASFAKRATAGENEYLTSSFEVYPSMSINVDFVPEYWLYYHTQSLDPTMKVTAIDDNELIIPSEPPSNATVRSPLQQTKNLTLTFTYTEPWTSASVSFDKTFSIVPEGKPGDESIVFEINPVSVNLKSNSRGDVTSYDQSATEIRLKQGSRYLKFNKTRTAGTFYTASHNLAIGSPYWITGSNIMTGSWIDTSPLGSAFDEYLLVSNASKFSDLSGSILYNLEIQPYYTSSVYTASITQNYTKILDGPEPIQILITPSAITLKADEVGYVNPVDYSFANTTIKVKEGDDFLRFTTQSIAPGTFRINSVETKVGNIWNIRTGSLSSSSLDTATLNFNRFDYPFVSASANYTIQVYPYALGAGHQYTSSIYTRTQTFNKSVETPKARNVIVTAVSETITYDRDTNDFSPQGDNTLTATVYNNTGSLYYYWYDADGNEIGTDPTHLDNTHNPNDSTGNPGPGEVFTYVVKITDGNPYTSPTINPFRAEGSISISGVKQGADSFKLVSTNDNCAITADLWTTTFTGTGMKITTFKGVDQLQNVAYYNPAYNKYDYLGQWVGILGYSSASIFSKSPWITMASNPAKFPQSNPAEIGNITAWAKPALSSSGQIVYKVEFEGESSGSFRSRQTQFVTQSISVQFTPPSPYNVFMQNENSSIVYKVSGELEIGGTGNRIKAYRGGQELLHKPSGFTGAQTDAYGDTGYPNQYRVSILSFSTCLSMPAGIDYPNAPVPGNPAQFPGITGWTDPENNPSAEIVYQIDCEYASGSSSRPGTTLFKTQSLSIQYEGAVGPGIVMRGEWRNDIDYIGQVETTNNRRDAVTYLATTNSTKYYAAISGSGPTTNDGQGNPVGYHEPTVDGTNAWWEYLGEEEFFVAAKIAIFEESYVKNTINVGTKDGTGAFANIVIAGGRTDPYIAIGQSATIGTSGTSGTTLNPGGTVIGYERPGIFLGIYEQPFGSGGTTGRFSIVNGAGNRYLKWNGSGLEIAGDITVTGGNAATSQAVSGSIASGSFTATQIAAANTAVAVNALSGSLGAMAAISSINSGNATTFIGPGVIVANMFAGTAIQSTNYVSGTDPIFSDTGTFINLAGSAIRMKGFGVNSAGDVFFKGNLTGATGIFRDNVTVGTGSVAIALTSTNGTGSLIGAGFSLGPEGLTVSNATISGVINASGGSIGSWTVENNILRDGNSRIFLDPSLPGIAIKESGTTKLKVNFGELTDLGGSNISLSAETLSYFDTFPASVGVVFDEESSGQSFSVVAGTYTDASVSWPGQSSIIQAFNREGNVDIYWGYRIYNTTTSALVSEVIIGSDYWIGGVDDSYASFYGYSGNFQFSAPEAASTSYTFKTFVKALGYQYSVGGGGGNSFAVSAYMVTPSISAVANVDIVELTNKGIQIASSADRFIKLRREDNPAIPIIDGKGFITLTGDTANTLLQLSGTTTGTAINIAASTGKIAMNGNNIEMGSGVVSWNPGSNGGFLTTYNDGGLRPAIIITNVGSPGGGTIRGMEISLSTWRIGRNTSARRYKEEIENWEHPSILDAINNVPIRTYYWKIDKDAEVRPQQIGIIAEELEAGGLEEYVDYDWFEDPENPEGPKQWMTSGIAKQELVFVLWKAVQELTQKVKDLEDKLNS
jgi:hypothetical protein